MAGDLATGRVSGESQPLPSPFVGGGGGGDDPHGDGDDDALSEGMLEDNDLDVRVLAAAAS